MRSPSLRPLAEIVHAAGVEDGKYARTEGVGIDGILKGWSRLG